MAGSSEIEWTDASWTPIRARNLKTGKIGWHCEHATTGCEFCYAEGMNKRLGTGLPFKPGHRKDIEIFLDEEMLVAPLRWKKPRMIFVCSMTDALADFVKDEWLDKMFAVMALCPQHTFQVLTKRAERMREYMQRCDKEIRHIVAAQDFVNDGLVKRGIEIQIKWPLPNVWLGVSIERQQEADERIPLLLQTPAAVRFISAEPLLGPINLKRIHVADHGWQDVLNGWRDCKDYPGRENILDWVIIGGESGGDEARPFNVEWADSLVEQCREADVPCFVKQLGSFPHSDDYPLELRDRKGGDPAEWPDRLNVRQFPKSSALRTPVVSQPSNAEAVVS